MFGLFQDPETKARNLLRAGKCADAFKLLQQLAVKGKPRAMSALGMMYMNGDGVARDFDAGRKWIGRAAALGLQEAQICMGAIYKRGDGVPIDFDEAFYWYEQAAQPCDYFSETGRFNHEMGDPRAKYYLGCMYADGQGVEQNHEKANQLFRDGAEQGDKLAQFGLAVSYEKGWGLTQDYAEAAKWYRLAADKGETGAQINLGNLYWKGLGVPQDKVLAHMWFNLAAARGKEAAIENRNDISEEMSSMEISKAQELARNWSR